MASDRDYEIQFAKSAGKALAKLPPRDLRRIAQIIEGLKKNPRPAGCKRLDGYTQPSDPPELHRIRWSHYRIIYSIKEHLVLVVVFAIADRKTVYDEFARIMGRGVSPRSSRR